MACSGKSAGNTSVMELEDGPIRLENALLIHGKQCRMNNASIPFGVMAVKPESRFNVRTDENAA